MDDLPDTCQRYGITNPNVVLVHGGPGAAGELAPLAACLAQQGYGVLEPWQTAATVEGQIAELHAMLMKLPAPVYLLGWSWGAWLALMVAARHPTNVCGLVLVGSGPFEEQYAKTIQSTRTARLSAKDRARLPQLFATMENLEHLTQALAILDKCDTYDRDDTPQPHVTFDRAIHTNVWAEAAQLRANGALTEALEQLCCPVTAIHGDHDPHPAKGVRLPLMRAQPDAAFYLLERCGHKPWQEMHAKASFLSLLERIMPKDTVTRKAAIDSHDPASF